MEFKRTAEGRVFFSGAKSASNDADRGSRREAPELTSPLTGKVLKQRPEIAEKTPDTPQSQYQVLALLKSLNEKLKLTQIERNSMRQELKAYRQMIDTLEKKSGETEKAFQTLQNKMQALPDNAAIPSDLTKQLDETRRLYEKLENRTERNDRNLSDLLDKAESHKQVSLAMSKKTADLERQQKQYASSLESGLSRVKEITDRLDTTEARQDELQGQMKSALDHEERFTALIEQERNDRARFMRKLEKLEETVLMINSGAHMQPALEDASTAGQGEGLHVPHYLIDKSPDDEPASTPKFALPENWSEKALDVWQKALNIPMPVAVFGGLVLVVSGWWISAQQMPSTNMPAYQYAPEASTQQGTASTQSLGAQGGETSAVQNWNVSKNVSEFAPLSLNNPNIPTQTQQNDLSQLMDADPDAAAAILNDMAPGQDQGAALSIPKLHNDQQALAPSTQADDAGNTNASLPQDFKTLEALAIQGNADAQHDLAALYVVGQNGVKQDYARAAYWFDRAAQNGVANAAYNMGVLYHQGLGVKASLEQAVKWYSVAAEQGHPEAAYNLGIAYIEGVGVDYDPFKATLHFEQAAANGTVEAAYNLGLIYENGLLGSAKPGEALMWYKIAADYNLPEAQTALNQLVESLGIDRAEIDRIVEDVKKSYPAMNKAAKASEKPATPASDIIPVSGLSASDAAASTVKASASTSAADTSSRIDLISAVQSELEALDLYPGPIDGRSGPLTEDAVRAYQKAYDLPVNGQITQALLEHMQQ